jgi:hypothetical protein
MEEKDIDFVYEADGQPCCLGSGSSGQVIISKMCEEGLKD